MVEMFDTLLEPLRYPFMLKALAVSVMMGVSGGMLGCVLLMRRMALMGDALAHSLLPGLAIAYLLFGDNALGLLIGAIVAGCLTAAGSAAISRLTRVKEDAAFAALFILFFGSGIALISASRAIRIDLMHFLFGNVLGVGSGDLWLAAIASSATVLAFALFYRAIAIEAFDPVFYRASRGSGGLLHVGLLALVVLNLVAALQAMGIVLALGLFLLPAVTAFLWCKTWGRMLVTSSILAGAGSVVGLLASYHVGIASGPCIVGVLGLAFLVSLVFAPKPGRVRGKPVARLA
jgi:zinc/manganese transport system permease protein